MIRAVRIGPLVLTMLMGLLPNCLAATWYTRSYYQRTGYLPFPCGPCGFALEAERHAKAFPSPVNDPTEDSK